jgi:ABC-type multidrug transport system fused ATPase/permease subunit
MSQQAGKSHHQQLYVSFSLTLCSVDIQTDARMQEVIRTEFSDRTIIMIAHRIDTLLDFDKVAVLDAGSLVEFGLPQELLGDEAGAFTRLYRANKGNKTDV